MLQELNQYKAYIQGNQDENKTLKAKIQKLLSENSVLGQDMQSAQENLRLSSAQVSKLNAELNEYRNKIEANNQET